MPSRGRNRKKWAVDPSGSIHYDALGYPLKFGDIVLGCRSGDGYRTVKSATGKVQALHLNTGKLKSVHVLIKGKLRRDLRIGRFTEFAKHKGKEKTCQK